jgi:transcriptional regulator with XRE-family HTH domain
MSNPEATAAEVRAALARCRITQTTLARESGRSQAYWSKRLNGLQPMTVADLATVSRLTSVPVALLIGEGAA